MTLLAFCLLGSAFVANVFVNADMSLDYGDGRPCGWSNYVGLPGTLKGRSSGAGTLELTTATGERSCLHQTPVALKPGGRYRLSAEVQTVAAGEARFALQVVNHYFADELCVEFPPERDCRWRTVAWEGAMIGSRDAKDYSIGFTVRGGKGGERVRVRNLKMEPLDTSTAAETTPLSTEGFAALPVRIVPVDPLLTRLNAEDAKVTCYWGGKPAQGVGRCTLVGLLGGVRRSARFAADGRATLDFGAVPEKAKRLLLGVRGPDGERLATNSYTVAVRSPSPKGPAGRRLNNFVTELHRGALANGEVRFFRSDDGWTWINFTGSGLEDARGFLDGEATPAVRYDPAEPHVEAMRFLPAGWHALKVAGACPGGVLRIHAVKQLCTALWGAWTVEGGPCRHTQGVRLSLPFLRRFVLPSNNTILSPPHHLADANSPVAAHYASRGFRLLSGAEVAYTKKDMTEAYLRTVLRDGMWSRGWGIQVDEIMMDWPYQNHVWTSEILWQMYEERPRQGIVLFYADAQTKSFDNPAVHVPEIAAAANLGWGTGVVAPELYAGTLRDEAAMRRYVDHFAKIVGQVGQAVPGARNCTYLHLNPYMQIGHWTSWIDPGVDVRAFYAHLMRTFATDPRFAENAGLGGGVTGYCEEELVRWFARCKRHYGIEGGTDDLAKAKGFRWRPGLVANGDFADGLAGWTVESGCVQAKTYAGYGETVQGRHNCEELKGDAVAEFTASETVSRLTQRVTGLTPGRLYALSFALANARTVGRDVTERLPTAFSGWLEGARRLDALSYAYDLDIGTSHVCTHRGVFRAERPEATIILEDRDEQGGSAEPGMRQIVNFVTVHPYYVENEDELTELFGFLEESGK